MFFNYFLLLLLLVFHSFRILGIWESNSLSYRTVASTRPITPAAHMVHSRLENSTRDICRALRADPLLLSVLQANQVSQFKKKKEKKGSGYKIRLNSNNYKRF